MSSLEKALDILNCFSLERPAVGVSEAAAELNMPKSSVSRMMKAMAQSGLLERNAGSMAYVPGVLAFQLGNLYHSNLAIQAVIDRAVADLVEKYGLTFYVGVLSGQEIILTGVYQGTYPIRLVLPKGSRIPAHVTAMGLALLARKSDDELRALYPTEVVHPETNVVLSPDEILSSIRMVRSLGYAAVDGSAHRGFSAISVAVNSASENQCISYSLSYPSELAASQDIETITGAILASAHDVGRRVADPYWINRAPVTAGRVPVEVVMAGGEPLPTQ